MFDQISKLMNSTFILNIDNKREFKYFFKKKRVE